MDRKFENTAPAPSLSGLRPMTFVPEVGHVPSGPRSSFSPFRISSRQAQTANNSSDVPVHIKQEETERYWFPDTATEEGKIPQNHNIKREESPEEAESLEFDTDYRNTFARLLASSQRSSRSDTTGSRRQDTSEGRWSRSDRSTTSQDSFRSRSPYRYERPASSRHLNRSVSPHRLGSTPSRGSLMFYPDSRASAGLYPDSYRPRCSRSSRATPNAAPEDSQRPRSPQQSSPTQDRPPTPLPATSPSLPRSLSLAPETQLVSSSTEPEDPSGEEEEEVQEDKRCRCPIDYQCRLRPGDHIDCRPLVREPKTWQERRDQEAFEQHREAGSQGERFTTHQGFEGVVNPLQDFLQATTGAARRSAIADIRDWIIDMEDVTLTAGVLQTSAATNIVPALTAFLAPHNRHARRVGQLPEYIEEELTVLERKWGRGDYSGAPKRGLTEVIVSDRNGIPCNVRYQVDPTWPFYVSAKYFGAGVLVNGQIWESRVELQRDGVHAPPIAGISGTANGGARSVVLGAFDEKNNIGYADIDMGDVIEYMGTALPDQGGLGPTNVKDLHMGIPGAWDQNSPVKPTAATQAMFKSLETGEPVRVIRSFRMAKIVKNKPVRGYRYDGLYRVTGATALKEARQIWSFRMQRLPERLPDHGPLRGFRTKADQPDSSGRRMGHFRR